MDVFSPNALEHAVRFLALHLDAYLEDNAVLVCGVRELLSNQLPGFLDLLRVPVVVALVRAVGDLPQGVAQGVNTGGEHAGKTCPLLLLLRHFAWPRRS